MLWVAATVTEARAATGVIAGIDLVLDKEQGNLLATLVDTCDLAVASALFQPTIGHFDVTNGLPITGLSPGLVGRLYDRMVNITSLSADSDDINTVVFDPVLAKAKTTELLTQAPVPVNVITVDNVRGLQCAKGEDNLSWLPDKLRGPKGYVTRVIVSVDDGDDDLMARLRARCEANKYTLEEMQVPVVQSADDVAELMRGIATEMEVQPLPSADVDKLQQQGKLLCPMYGRVVYGIARLDPAAKDALLSQDPLPSFPDLVNLFLDHLGAKYGEQFVSEGGCASTNRFVLGDKSKLFCSVYPYSND